MNVSVLGNIHLLTDFLKKHSGGNLQEKERILKQIWQSVNNWWILVTGHGRLLCYSSIKFNLYQNEKLKIFTKNENVGNVKFWILFSYISIFLQTKNIFL